MSRVVECDGCGTQAKNTAGWSEVEVEFTGQLVLRKEFDLCRSCTDSFKARLPDQWVREKDTRYGPR